VVTPGEAKDQMAGLPDLQTGRGVDPHRIWRKRLIAESIVFLGRFEVVSIRLVNACATIFDDTSFLQLCCT